MTEAQQILASYKTFDPNEYDPEQAAKILWRKGAYRTQAAKMLRLFQDAQSHNDGFIPTYNLSNLFSQYNARILELRSGKHDGILYSIVAAKQNGKFGFRYKGIRSKGER
jgi:hypothetical protein